ncbi:hypothetical protein E2F43_13980 [Seongchinamella unica]|uniref:Response regulatory domain-containing protein n=1 Tax=Seongchinamella unica TaxID=2547392 RepID=A0A4R5LQ44_9GAMM|nr:hypothetical protein [Seongchinamella unica]TDG12684.1 hypothetical protein E2F43_13980 [Seongchinamella unica]
MIYTVVDSESAHRSRLEQLARACGFSVECGADVADIAVERVAEFDLIFFELSAESLDGNHPVFAPGVFESTEVFVMSETDTPEAADWAIWMGASYYFRKPGDSESLRPLLEDIAAEAASGENR